MSIYTRLLEPDKISHTESMVAKWGCTDRANVHTRMWKSRLKHSTAELQSIQQFLLQLDIDSEPKKQILLCWPKLPHAVIDIEAHYLISAYVV